MLPLKAVQPFCCNGGLLKTARSLVALRSKFTLPDLPYDYNALEPVIATEIMRLHHSKHHAAYVSNFNASEDKLDQAVRGQENPEEVKALQSAVHFNRGGHINHSIFWKHLIPKSQYLDPPEPLMKAFEKDFGGFDKMKAKLSAMSIGVQGSGWGWLGISKETKKMSLTTCANQDPLEDTKGLIPLVGIDVWEHAYYLQYKNLRADYVHAIWQIINWKQVYEQYRLALC